MKKLIAMLIALMMCLSAACAEEGDAAFAPTESNKSNVRSDNAAVSSIDSFIICSAV